MFEKKAKKVYEMYSFSNWWYHYDAIAFDKEKNCFHILLKNDGKFIIHNTTINK